MAGPRNLNIVSLTFYLLIAAGVYFSIQYAPLFWKKSQLESLVKEHSYSAKRKAAEDVRQSLVNDAQSQLNIYLDPEDVYIDKLKDRVRMYILWRRTIDHPFGKSTRHIFQVEMETLFF